MTAAWQRSPDLTKPRAQRTHDHVLAVARSLLHEAGPDALTFSALGERAQVTRQTLYRHWPTRELLLTEIVTTGPDVGYPTRGDDAREVLGAFLRTLRAGLDDPPSAASLLAITARAGSDPTCANTLATISEDRRAALNALLEPSGTHLEADDFAQIVGPVIYSVLHARHPVSDELITRIVDTWLADPDPSRCRSRRRDVRGHVSAAGEGHENPDAASPDVVKRLTPDFYGQK